MCSVKMSHQDEPARYVEKLISNTHDADPVDKQTVELLHDF